MIHAGVRVLLNMVESIRGFGQVLVKWQVQSYEIISKEKLYFAFF